MVFKLFQMLHWNWKGGNSYIPKKETAKSSNSQAKYIKFDEFRNIKVHSTFLNTVPHILSLNKRSAPRTTRIQSF